MNKDDDDDVWFYESFEESFRFDPTSNDKCKFFVKVRTYRESIGI